MAKQKGGLGRGLAALIPSGPDEGPRLSESAADAIFSGPTAASGDVSRETEVSAASEFGATYREINPHQVEPNPKQPRTTFDPDALEELVHSVREFGLLQPIVVRELSEPHDGVHYQLIMGERRLRASREAGLEAIPAIVRQTPDGDMLRDALLENIHRAQLNPLEEAAAYQQLLEEFDVTHEKLAAQLGRSRAVISNTIRLLRLPVLVQKRVASGVLTAGHARALLGLDNPEQAEELASRIVKEGLSVRSTEEAVTLLNSAGPVKPSSPKRKPMQMPGLQDVAERLSDKLDTRVLVSLGKRKGKITVEFGSVEDLERIVALMSDGTGSVGNSRGKA